MTWPRKNLSASRIRTRALPLSRRMPQPLGQRGGGDVGGGDEGRGGVVESGMAVKIFDFEWSTDFSLEIEWFLSCMWSLFSSNTLSEGWLLNIPTTCICSSNLPLPHLDKSCRIEFLSHLDRIYWHWPTSLSTDPTRPDVWQGSYYSTCRWYDLIS